MQDFNSMMTIVNSVFTTINSTISEMADGDRHQLKDLSKIISDKTGADMETASAFVDYFSHNTNMGYVSRGKRGGFVKGSKPSKPSKPAKSVNQALPTEEVEQEDME